MAFAVDGTVTIMGLLACQFGDSAIVAEDAFDSLTDYPRKVRVI